jgi:hypothetical protein
MRRLVVEKDELQPPDDVPRRPRLRQRAGRCYELAGHAALMRQDWAVVQGFVSMHDGRRMGHAWNERAGWVYDAVLDRTMPKADFEARFAVSESTRWQGQAVAAALLKHGHWGPWNDDNTAE